MPILIGVGFTLLADEFKQYQGGRVCFWLSALWLWGKVIVWSLFSSDSFRVRSLIAFLVCGVVGVLLVEALRLTSLREHSDPNRIGTANTAVSLRFKHTALVFYQRNGSPFVENKPISIKSEYENTSDASAQEVSASGVLRIIDVGDDQAEKENQEWKIFRDAWLSTLQGSLKTQLDPHKTGFIENETDPLSGDQVQALRNTKKVVYFFGILKWSDPTGVYETDICTYFLPDQHGPVDAPAIWHQGLSGHDAVRKSFQIADVLAPYSQRANIQIVGLEFDTSAPTGPLRSGKPFFLRVTFRNTGPTPANKLGMVARLGLSDSDSERDDQERLFQLVRTQTETVDYGANSLPPGKTGFVTLQYPLAKSGERALRASDIQQITQGKKQIVLALVAKYSDEYGPRATHFCQSYQGTSWRYWTDCYGHNQVVP